MFRLYVVNFFVLKERTVAGLGVSVGGVALAGEGQRDEPARHKSQPPAA